MERPKLKIELTAGDKVLEVMAAVALIGLWCFAFYSYNNLPDTIPIHFNHAGEADGYGDKQTIFLTPVIATLVTLVLTAVNRYPEVFNYPVTITPENAQKQYSLATRMLRMLKIGVILVFFVVDAYTFANATGQSGDTGYLLLPAISVIMFVPLIYYFIEATRNK